MDRVTLDPPAIAVAAAAYLAAGWVPVRIHGGTKRPIGEEWQLHPPTVDQFNEGDGVGVLVGASGNHRIDADLDCSAAVGLAPFFLPETKCISGHASAPRSHYWFVSEPAPSYQSFSDVDGEKLLELRSGFGQQTVVPPSMVDGEPRIWYEREELATVEPAILQQSCQRLAAAVLVVRHYPATGERHRLAMCLPGYLLRQGWSEAEVLHFVRAIATASKDEETLDRLKSVESTQECFAAGKNVTGGVALRKILGKDVLDKFTDFLGLSRVTGQREKTELPFMDLPPLEKENLGAWPQAAVDGDLIADLTHVLGDGTTVPLQYIRETIVLALGALADGRLYYPGHELPVRRYLSIISELPAAGKRQSYKRVLGESGQLTYLGKILLESGIKVLDGGVVGSGQYLAHVVEEFPKSIVVWDELSELMEKSSQQASTLLSSLKKLFESNVHWSGSFTNKKHGSDDVHLSVLLHCTRPSFSKAFTGKGAVGDGLLSRFVLAYAPLAAVPVPEWTARNYSEEERLAALLDARIPHEVLVPAIDEAARTRLNDFLIELRRPTHPHVEYVQRLDALTKVDLLHRALYGHESEARITVEAVDRSIAWAEHQLKLRLGQWTADSGRPVEALIQTVLRRLEKGPATEVQLKDATHVYRDGSHETFNRAIAALVRSSQIEAIGQSHKHTAIFALVKEED
jgi:hypothetical protein